MSPEVTTMWGSHKTTMPTTETALPGRAERMPVPATHHVSGRPLTPPFPAGMQTAIFGLGCFWGAEKAFWLTPGVFTTAVGYAAGLTPNPTYEEVCTGRTGHNEVVLVVFDPTAISYEALLRVLGGARSHAGHAPGQRRRHAVPLRHLRGVARAARGRRGVARRLPARADSRRPRPHHHRDPRRVRVLLRRGLSPAVPQQEPMGLLRPRRHRRGVSDGRRGDRARVNVSAPGDWPTAKPEDAALDPRRLDDAIAYHRAHETRWRRDFLLDDGCFIGVADESQSAGGVLGPVRPRGGPSGLVVRGGRVVADWGDTERVEMSFSIAKSYLAALACVAVAHGLIETIDDPVRDYATDNAFVSEQNRAITWRHLLQQTSEW